MFYLLGVLFEPPLLHEIPNSIQHLLQPNHHDLELAQPSVKVVDPSPQTAVVGFSHPDHALLSLPHGVDRLDHSFQCFLFHGLLLFGGFLDPPIVNATPQLNPKHDSAFPLEVHATVPFGMSDPLAQSQWEKPLEHADHYSIVFLFVSHQYPIASPDLRSSAQYRMTRSRQGASC